MRWLAKTLTKSAAAASILRTIAPSENNRMGKRLKAQPRSSFSHITSSATFQFRLKCWQRSNSNLINKASHGKAKLSLKLTRTLASQRSVETNAAHHPKIGSYQIARLDKRHSRSVFPCRTNARRVPFYCINISHWDTVNECDVWFTFPIVPTVCRFALRCSKRLQVACGWIQAACSYQPIDQANSGWVVDY